MPPSHGDGIAVLHEFLAKVPTEQHLLVHALHTCVTGAAPELKVSLKWGNLTYHAKRNACAIVSHRDHVNLQVWDAIHLDDPSRLLEGTGKEMRHIAISNEGEFDAVAIGELVKLAALRASE